MNFIVFVVSWSCFLFSVTSKAVEVGLYIDNGENQTVLDRSLTMEEKIELEEDILGMLGLQEKPKITNPPKKPVSDYLFDIYHLMNDDDIDDDLQENTLGYIHTQQINIRKKRSFDFDFFDVEEKQRIISDSDIIMSFESIPTGDKNLRHDKGQRMTFEVKQVKASQDIMLAELRVFARNPSKNRVFTLDVHQIHEIKEVGSYEHIASVNITKNFTGWLSLNITRVLPSWVAFPDSNKGLYLSLRMANKPGIHYVRLLQLGIVSDTQEGTDPFVVVYIKANNQVNVPTRTARSMARKKPKVKKSAYTTMMKAHGKGSHEKSTLCNLRTLHISFRELEWKDWILAPDGYSAYFCAGECNFPLNAHMNATNHAIIQTLMHLMHPTKYPKPCCAPSKLSPVSVLYLDDVGVQIKKYRKMAVRTCGCH